MNDELDLVRAQWARLGAGLAGAPADASPDVEQLVLDTVRCSAASPQLVIAAVTWLGRFAGLVAEHRLEAMVRRAPDLDRARLGLLLELAATAGRPHDRRRNLQRTLRLCAPAAAARPFYDVANTSPAMIERAERRASEVSRRWNLWMDPVEPKHDALRSIGWIVERNPALRWRADFRGDLRASLLCCLAEADDAAHPTISELARRIGASRLATTHALDELELGGHVACARAGRTKVYRVQAEGWGLEAGVGGRRSAG